MRKKKNINKKVRIQCNKQVQNKDIEILDREAEKRKEEKVSLSDKINIFIAVLTLVSVIGVFVSLREMQIQRNTAYKPSIVMNPVEVEFEWDEYGNEDWTYVSNRETEDEFEIDENGNVTGTMEFSIIGLDKSYTEYSVTNIGVGTAKNITFKWNENNTQRLYDYVIECGSERVGECSFGPKSDAISINHQSLVINKEKTWNLMYMLPEAQETYSLQFPIQYTLLIHEIIKTGKFKASEYPYVVLNITYQDIQGEIFNEAIVILVSVMFREEKPDGTGRVIYQLGPVFPENK